MLEGLQQGAVKNQPKNLNPLFPHRFKLVFARVPNVTYFVQEVNIPGIAMGNSTRPTPFVDIPIYGDKVQFSDLVVVFNLDEKMADYREIQRWIRGIGFPEKFDQFKALKEYTLFNNPYKGVTSDAILCVLDNSENPLTYVHFQDCFPISISDIQFDTKATDDTPVPVTVTFKYTVYDFIDDPSQVPTALQLLLGA